MGVIVAIAAGNDGHFCAFSDKPPVTNPDYGTVGSPGVAKDALTVAAMYTDVERVRTISIEGVKGGLKTGDFFPAYDDEGEIVVSDFFNDFKIAINDIDEDLIEKEQIMITLSHNQYIKRLAASTYKSQGRGGRGVNGMTTNYLYNDNYFNRVQMNDKGVYRGEKKEGSTDNTGTAKYGLGRYRTTDKKYASKFGNVREVHLDELPSRPLSFKDELAFQMFEQELAKEHGMKLKHMNQYNRVDEIIQKMGYNGLTIGPKNNMIIVSYWTPKDYDKVRGY